MVAVLVLGDARRVGGVGDVHRNSSVRVEAEGRTPRPVKAYLLLHARHSDDLGGEVLLLGEQAQGFEHDEGAHAVVHRAGDDAAVRKLHEVLVEDAGVADADHALRLVSVLGADVDPQALYLGGLLALLGLHEVDGLLADHADYLAVLRPQPHPLADEYLRVPAPDAGEPEPPPIVDVGDDHPDLVYVAREHYPRRAPADGAQRRVRRAATTPPRPRARPPRLPRGAAPARRVASELPIRSPLTSANPRASSRQTL